MSKLEAQAKKSLIEVAQGVYVEQDVLNIVEKIREYDPSLNVKYCDPSVAADPSDPPYKVVERCPDGMERVVFNVWKLDEQVLDRLYLSDRYRHDILGQIDTKNALARDKANQRFLEERHEAIDITTSMLKSPKGRWSVETNGRKITFDDQEGIPAKVEVVDGP